MSKIALLEKIFIRQLISDVIKSYDEKPCQVCHSLSILKIKAFDSLERNFLFKVLQVMNFDWLTDFIG